MKLYTTPTCGPCKRVKMLINANGYPVEIIDDVSAFPPGLRSVPTLEVEEGVLITGDAPIIKKLKEENAPIEPNTQ